MPRLLHLADVHLGARHADLGEAAAAQRERQLAAFDRAIGLASERAVDAVLICGDLFDSNAQPRRSVERAAAELRRLTDRGIHVLVIPGTHDCYDTRSIYRAFDLRTLCGLPPDTDLLHVLVPERPEAVLRDLDMVVYGRVFATKRAPRSPLEGFSARSEARARWRVGMIHGSLHIPGRVERDDVLFSDAEVAASGLDYLALGHWHSFLQGRAGDTVWAYAGAPEPVAVDQDGAGKAVLVELAEREGQRRVTLEPLQVGRTRFRVLDVDAAGLASGEDLVRRIGELADPDLVLEVRLHGIAPERLEVRADEVRARAGASFLHLRVVDRSVAALADGEAPPPDTVAGAFVADLEARLADATARDDEAAVAELREVLRLGRLLLLDDPARVSLP